MKPVLSASIAALAGLVGGFLGTRVFPGWQPGAAPTVQARRFELIDKTGRVISMWGIDDAGNAVLAFGEYWPDGTGPDGRTTYSILPLTNPEGQRTAIGVIADAPYVELRAADGKMRARFDLNMWGKPCLWMSDEREARLALGILQSDTPGPQDNTWGLSFEPGLASIGAGPYVENGVRDRRAFFYISKKRLPYTPEITGPPPWLPLPKR